MLNIRYTKMKKSPLNWKNIASSVDEFITQQFDNIDSQTEIREVGDYFEITLSLAGYAKEDVKVRYNAEKDCLFVLAMNHLRGKYEHKVELGPEFDVKTLQAKIIHGLLIIKIKKNILQKEVDVPINSV